MPRELVAPFQAAPEVRKAPAPLATIAAPAGQCAGAPLNSASPAEPAQAPGQPARAAVLTPARPS
eukprot:13336473-Alexandrium_andersonii.AAC.1